MRRVIVIGGPTAAGKTATSLALASLLPCEIICADARQVYCGLNIGTAKPSQAERSVTPHHLFDILEPSDTINAAEYAERARSVIEMIPPGVFPVMVGGSGLYISAALDGLSPSVVAVDESIRLQVQLELTQVGRDALYDELCRVDPVAARVYHDRNPRRITRALEVFRATGRPISDLWQKAPTEMLFEVLHIGVTCERSELRERIRRRSNLMWSEGLLEEVEGLLSSGVLPTSQSMQSVGYREAISVLKGEMNLEEAKERLITATWHYAKRQLTWFTRDLRYTWLGADPESNARTIWTMLRERNWIDE